MLCHHPRPLLTPNAQEMLKRGVLGCGLWAMSLVKSDFFLTKKIYTGDVAVNCHNSCYLTDLPVAYVDPSICISPFSMAPLKQIVLGAVGSDGQMCPIGFFGIDERVNAAIYQDFLREHVWSPRSRERSPSNLTSSSRFIPCWSHHRCSCHNFI